MIDSILTFKTRNRDKKIFIRSVILMLAVALLAAAQTSCSKKVRIPIEDSGPVRLVVLPFTVSADKPGQDKELQWVAMAAPALLVKTSRRLPDIDVVPFWEVMPAAIQAAGASRSFTDESASAIANWVSAQWAVMGEIRRTGSSSYTVVVDFIPGDPAKVPFRHIRTRRMETVGTTFYLGLRQWLRYVTSRPIPLLSVREPGLQRMQQIGEALDKEYGWLVTAEPGTSQSFINELVLDGEDWVRLVFSPTMYPSLAK
jgi:hypothetical protein